MNTEIAATLLWDNIGRHGKLWFNTNHVHGPARTLARHWGRSRAWRGEQAAVMTRAELEALLEELAAPTH